MGWVIIETPASPLPRLCSAGGQLDSLQPCLLSTARPFVHVLAGRATVFSASFQHCGESLVAQWGYRIVMQQQQRSSGLIVTVLKALSSHLNEESMKNNQQLTPSNDILRG